MNFFFKLKTSTPGNGRRHWRLDWREAKIQRGTVKRELLAMRDQLPPFPVKVKITRHAPGELDPQNCPGAAKHVIDGIADAYRVNDRDKRWKFSYAQKKTKRGVYGVEVEIVSYGKAQEIGNI